MIGTGNTNAALQNHNILKISLLFHHETLTVYNQNIIL